MSEQFQPAEGNLQEAVTPGTLLRKARQAKDMSSQDVAAKLYLTVDLIEDIEADRYQALPFAYLKGYLKSYARLVLIPEEQILMVLERSKCLEQYKNFSPSPKAVRLEPVYTREKTVSRSWPMALFVGCLVAVVFVALFYYETKKNEHSATAQTSAPMPLINQSQAQQIDVQLKQEYSANQTPEKIS